MDNSKFIVSVLEGLTIFSLLIAGALIGRTSSDTRVEPEEVNDCKQCEVCEEPKDRIVYLNDRLSECESKGGRYGLLWNKSKEEYFEMCDTPSQEVEGF